MSNSFTKPFLAALIYGIYAYLDMHLLIINWLEYFACS